MDSAEPAATVGRRLRYSRCGPAIIASLGLAALLLSLTADSLGLGLYMGFGPKQSALAVVGGLTALAGLLLALSGGTRELLLGLAKAVKTRLQSDGAERYAWLVSLGLVTVFFLLLFLLLNRRYDYLDDVASMRDYFRAGVAPLYSAQVVGQALSFLYRRASQTVPWYGLALYLTQLVLLTVWVYLALTKRAPTAYKAVLGFTILVMYVPFVMRASYNYASILSGGVAFLALFHSIQTDKRQRGTRAFAWGCLLALSFAWRPDGAIAAGLFVGIPVLVLSMIEVLRARISVGRVVSAVMVFFLPLLLVFALEQVQIAYQLTDEEKLHRTANEVRAPSYAFDLYPQMVRTPSLLDANGWTPNDVVMAEYAMNLFDEGKFGIVPFARVFDPNVGLSRQASRKDHLHNLAHFGQLDGFQWLNLRWESRIETWEYWPYYMIALALTLVVTWGGRDWYQRLFAIAYLVYVYLLSTYMLNYLRLPRHVAVPVLVLSCMILFSTTDVDFGRLVRRWYSGLLVVACCFLLLVSLSGFMSMIWGQNREIVTKRGELLETYGDLTNRLGADAFGFIRPQLYLSYFVDPLADQGPNTNAASLEVSSGAFSPMWYDLLRERGLQYGYQVLPWMVDNPKAYFVSNEQWFVQSVQRFIFETFGIATTLQPVLSLPGGLTVYRFLSQGLPVSEFVETYSLVDNLGQAEVMSDGPENVHRSTFDIGGEVREVLFEHPPSQVTYRVDVPPEASLQFHTALSPEVWYPSVAEGDGVEFEIYVTNKEGQRRIFSEYIDPKALPSHRQWNSHGLDLSEWAGQMISITLATNPGPQGDSRYDWAGWGEPDLGQWSYFDFSQKFYLAQPAPERLDQARRTRVKIGNSWRQAIFQHPTGRLTFPVHVEPGTLFQFAVGLEPATWAADIGDGVEFEAYVEEEGNAERIFARYVDPKNNPSDRTWFYETVDLSRFGGRDVKITLATRPGPADDSSFDWALWVVPRLIEKGFDHVRGAVHGRVDTPRSKR